MIYIGYLSAIGIFIFKCTTTKNWVQVYLFRSCHTQTLRFKIWEPGVQIKVPKGSITRTGGSNWRSSAQNNLWCRNVCEKQAVYTGNYEWYFMTQRQGSLRGTQRGNMKTWSELTEVNEWITHTMGRLKYPRGL